MFRASIFLCIFISIGSAMPPCFAERPPNFDNQEVTCDYDVAASIKMVALGRIWFVPNSYVVRRFVDRVELQSESFVRTAYPLELPDVSWEERVAVEFSTAIFGSAELLANGLFLTDEQIQAFEANEKHLHDLTISSYSREVNPGVHRQYTLVQSEDEFILLIGSKERARGGTLPWCSVRADL